MIDRADIRDQHPVIAIALVRSQRIRRAPLGVPGMQMHRDRDPAQIQDLAVRDPLVHLHRREPIPAAEVEIALAAVLEDPASGAVASMRAPVIRFISAMPSL